MSRRSLASSASAGTVIAAGTAAVSGVSPVQPTLASAFASRKALIGFITLPVTTLETTASWWWVWRSRL